MSGIGVIFARWPGVSNNERVTYEVHIAPQSSGATFAVGPGTLYAKTDATSITIKTDASGEPLNYTTATNPAGYYVRIVSVDSDGSSAASTASLGNAVQITGPDIFAGSVTATEIAATTITGDKFSSNLVLGSTISTAISGARVNLSLAGMTIYGYDGQPIVDLPTGVLNDDPTAPVTAFVKAIIQADGLTVDGSTNLGPTTNIPPGSIVSLRQGVSAPGIKPSMTAEYDTTSVALPSRTYNGWTKGHDGRYYTISSDKFGKAGNEYAWYLFAWNSSTGLVSQIPVTGSVMTPNYDRPTGLVYDGTNYYAIGFRWDNTYYFYRINTSFVVTQVNNISGLPQFGYSGPILGIETGSVTSRGKFVIAQINSNHFMRFLHYTIPASSSATLSPDNAYTGTDAVYYNPTAVMVALAGNSHPTPGMW